MLFTNQIKMITLPNPTSQSIVYDIWLETYLEVFYNRVSGC